MKYEAITAPVYTKHIVDEFGRPILMGYAPLRYDDCAPSGPLYLMPMTPRQAREYRKLTDMGLPRVEDRL